MSYNLLDVISVKNCITEFIIKLYSILEKNEFHGIISWSTNNRQVVIKDQKALEREVLPMFFRHSKIDSFIRQLNMYGFRKMAKDIGQKQAISFKNDNFRRGNIESLVLIKRRKKVMSTCQQEDENSSAQECQIQRFKEFVRTNIGYMQEQIIRLRREYPTVAGDFTRALQISNILIGKDMNHQLSGFDQENNQPNLNLFKTVKDIQAKIQPNNTDLVSFDSRCSIDDLAIYG